MVRRRWLLGLLLCVSCSRKAEPDRERHDVEGDRAELAWTGPDEVGTRAPPRPADQCELGQSKPCFTGMTGIFGPDADRRFRQVCVRSWDGVLRYSKAQCNTPLVLAFDPDSHVAFTSPEATFAIGRAANTEWVSASTPWLARDLDGSGCIEDQSELFGAPTDGSGDSGFDKLRALDDNGDGFVDAQDAAFASLVLWFDRDQDKRCTAGELMSLSEARVLRLDVQRVTSSPEEAHASSFEGESGDVWLAGGDMTRRGRLIDVYLRPVR